MYKSEILFKICGKKFLYLKKKLEKLMGTYLQLRSKDVAESAKLSYFNCFHGNSQKQADLFITSLQTWELAKAADLFIT